MPIWLIERVLLGRFTGGKLRQSVAAAIAQVAPAVLRSRLRSVMAVDVRQALAATRVPLLYLRASEDRLVPAAAGESIARIRVDVRLVEIPAPHCLLQAAPDQAARQLVDFARSL